MLHLEVTNDDFRAEVVKPTFLLHSPTELLVLILLWPHNEVHTPLPADFISPLFTLRIAVKHTVAMENRCGLSQVICLVLHKQKRNPGKKKQINNEGKDMRSFRYNLAARKEGIVISKERVASGIICLFILYITTPSVTQIIQA
jgi:hypothetical protein